MSKPRNIFWNEETAPALQEFERLSDTMFRLDQRVGRAGNVALLTELAPYHEDLRGLAFTGRGAKYDPLDPDNSPFGEWLAMQVPTNTILNQRMASKKLLMNAAGLAFAAKEVAGSRDVPEWLAERRDIKAHWDKVIEGLRQTRATIQSYLNQMAPQRFTYKGFKVTNRFSLMDPMVRRLLDGIDYLVALFKRRGVSDLLTAGVNVVELKLTDPWDGQGLKSGLAHGRYSTRRGAIELYSDAARGTGGRLLHEKWAEEVFLHEFGHHVHLRYLPSQAKAFWDAPWEALEGEVETFEKERWKTLYDEAHVTPEDRKRYWRMIERDGWDPRKTRRKLKGDDQAKFVAWLAKPMVNSIFKVTPKTVRMTSYGVNLFKFFANPEGSIRDWNFAYVDHVDPKELQATVKRTRDRYLENLSLDGWNANTPYPEWQDVTEIKALLDSEAAALRQVKIREQVAPVSWYGETNVKEDFAEAFVAFMANPAKLTPQAEYRMGRTLWLSGFYGKPVLRLARRVVDAWLEQTDMTPTAPSAVRVADTWFRQGRKVPLNEATVAQFRKDFLLFMRNINRGTITDYDKLVRFRNAILVWSERFAEFGRQIRDELQGRIRVWKNQKAWEQGGDIQWAQWYLENMGPFWEFQSEFRHIPEFVSLGYLRKYKPGWSDDEYKEMVHRDFMKEAVKWANRTKRKARGAWKYLNDLADWAERGGLYGGGAETVLLTDLEDENVQIEGFKLLFKGFDDSGTWRERLPLLKAGLREYRKRAQKVFPWLLQHALPIEVYWTRGRGSAGADYARSHINLYPWGLVQDTPQGVSRVMAHEMGHHVWAQYLSGEAKEFWKKAIRGDYTNLDLRDVLAVPGGIRARELGRTHPLLYLQVETLIHSPSYSGLDLYSKQNIQEYLDEGGDPIVRVPAHPITGYAAKNPEESFCEALGMLVAYGPKAVLGKIVWLLRTILPQVRVARGVARELSAAETGNGESVGIFIKLPAALAKQFPVKENDPSPQHVTFVYAGEVSAEQKADVLAIMQKHMDQVRSPVKARLGALDYFEHGHRRVPHLAVHFSADMALARDRILTELRDYGIIIKEFSPLVYRAHTTLAYLEDGEREYKGDIPKGSWEFNEVEVWGLPQVHKLKMGGSHRVAAGNQDIIEAPHNHHPVKLEPAKAKRKVYPFEGYIDFQGIQIDVENAKGSKREGTDPNGNEWSIKMHAHYGEIRGTEGTDGDKLDVYIGDNHDSSVVVVIHQMDPETGKFDEDKVMLGFDSVEEAIGAYKKQYDRPGFYRDGEYLEMPIGQFWRWVKEDRNRGKKVRAAESAERAEQRRAHGLAPSGDRVLEQFLQA